MNIRLRLTLWYTAVLTLILVVFSASVYLGLSRSLLIALDNHLGREVGQLIGGLKFDNKERDNEADQENSEQTARQYSEIELGYHPEEGILWRVLDKQGRRMVDPGQLDSVSIDPGIVNIDRTQAEYSQLDDGTPIRLYSVPFIIEGQGSGVVQVAESYRYIQEVQRQLILLFAIGVPFTILAASVGGWFLAAGALNPIDRITRAAQQISADDLHQRLNLKLPNDEVGRLAITFDQMLARLEDAFERQKQFIADASHEMRTPLTILKGDVEVALNRPRSALEYRETLEMVNHTTDRLASMVEELFLLARADNDQYPLQLNRVDLSKLLTEQVSKLLPRALSKNIALSLDTPNGLILVADADKLTRLFINLIDNAIKYSSSGDAIYVTAAIRNGQACVTIADTGPGISPEHLPYLFERFYRIDKARSRHSDASESTSSGAGLGLSIVHWLAKAHGGSIEVTSQPGQGSIFTIWLPLDGPPPA